MHAGPVVQCQVGELVASIDSVRRIEDDVLTGGGFVGLRRIAQLDFAVGVQRDQIAVRRAIEVGLDPNGVLVNVDRPGVDSDPAERFHRIASEGEDVERDNLRGDWRHRDLGTRCGCLRDERWAGFTGAEPWDYRHHRDREQGYEDDPAPPGHDHVPGEERPEVLIEPFGRVATPTRVGLERMFTDPLELARYAPVDPADRHVHGFPRLASDRFDRGTLIERAAGQEVIEHSPQAEDVGAGTDQVGSSSRLLGAHVTGRAANPVLHVVGPGVPQSSQPEIDQAGPAPVVDQDVPRLDILVDHPLRMEIGNGPRSSATSQAARSGPG